MKSRKSFLLKGLLFTVLSMLVISLSACKEEVTNEPLLNKSTNSEMKLQKALAGLWTTYWSGTNINGWIIRSDDQVHSSSDNINRTLFKSANGSYAAIFYNYSSNPYMIAGNSGNGQFGSSGWYINSSDKYAFDNNGRMLAVNSPYAMWITYQSGTFYNWSSNNGNSYMGSWGINNDDVYLTGRFRSTTAEVLCMNARTQYHGIFYAYATPQVLQQLYLSNSLYLGGWMISSSDGHTVADFDGDGYDEILFWNPGSGWAAIQKFNSNNNTWSTIWQNSGSGYIGGWQMNNGDKMVSGNFETSSSNIDVLAVSSWSNAGILTYSNGSWITNWYNNGNQYIDNWGINSNDKYQSLNGTLLFLQSSGMTKTYSK